MYIKHILLTNLIQVQKKMKDVLQKSSRYSSRKKNFPRYRLVSCIVLVCNISYEISCLMHNNIFMWARELMRSRTRYRSGFCEISYKISFWILQDFVRAFAC